MNKGTKVTLGLGLVGLTTGIVFSKKVLNKFNGVAGRHKIKKLVEQNIDVNDKILDVIDHLSDDEISTLAGILKKSVL